MVGRRVLLRVEKGPAAPGPVRLEIRDLSLVDDHGVARLKSVSFDVRAGEILGIAGVAGNGQSELLEVLAGYAPATGSVRLNGQALDLSSMTNADDRRDLGIAHVPEDRHRRGTGHALRGMGEFLLRLPPRGPAARAAGDAGPHRDPRPRAPVDRALRHPPAVLRPEDRELLRRQPAEDRARPRDRARARGAADRPADARRRHRRDRVHPPADRRAARPRARRSCWSRSSSTRSRRSATASS